MLCFFLHCNVKGQKKEYSTSCFPLPSSRKQVVKHWRPGILLLVLVDLLHDLGLPFAVPQFPKLQDKHLEHPRPGKGAQ